MIPILTLFAIVILIIALILLLGATSYADKRCMACNSLGADDETELCALCMRRVRG